MEHLSVENCCRSIGLALEVLFFERHYSIEDSSNLVPETSRFKIAITRSWKGRVEVRIVSEDLILTSRWFLANSFC